jgi:Tol biopolymer transport system component
MLAVPPGSANAVKDETSLLSLARVIPGGKVNAAASPISVSADGRYVTFATQADNLDPNDTSNDEDVYVRDTVAGTTTLVTPGDGPGDASGGNPSISDDGQMVAFVAYDEIDPNDTNGNKSDVYVADMSTSPPSLSLVSRPTGTGAGAPAPPLGANSPVISGDGTVVAFVSSDNTLDPLNDTDVTPGAFTSQDVFVREMDTDTTELVSRGATDGNRASWSPSLDTDGSHVAFDSQSDNLDIADVTQDRDVYLRDRIGDTLTLISRADGPAGAKSNGDAFISGVSGDGGVVAFISTASNLDPDDPDVTFDVFVRTVSGDDTELVSRASGVSGAKANKISQGASISADGTRVAFLSSADNLDPAMTTVGSTNHAYIRNLTTNTTRIESRADGGSGVIGNDGVQSAVIASGGIALAFETKSTNLDPGDTDTITDAYVRNTGSGDTVLASLAPFGTPVNANGDSRDPSMSADGRYIAFTSSATNLDPAASNNRSDIFVLDTETDELELASRADGPGPEGDGSSGNPSISADGRFVAFESDAENIATDGDGEQDVFVRDLENDTTTLVSLTSLGQNIPGGFPSEPSISTGGERVAFVAEDSYHPDDGNFHSDIYVRDLDTGSTLVASRPDGVTSFVGSDASYLPDISDDGSSVAFESNADNLTGISPVQQIVVRDIDANTTRLASRAGGASGAAGSSESRRPTISSDGSRVAFHSDSTNLHPDDPTSNGTIFVRDLETDETLLVSKTSTGASATGTSSNAAISGDGTYVAFQSSSNELDPAATATRPDVFHHDLVTGDTVLVSRMDGPAGAEGNDTADRPTISEHGRLVAFNSAATNLDPADTDSQGDVYLRDVLGPDTTAPVTTITSGPLTGSFRAATAFTFWFTVNEPNAATECRLDGGVFRPCSTNFPTGRLAAGLHTFQVRSTDRAGNLEIPVKFRSFTVDTSIRGRAVRAVGRQRIRGRKIRVKVTVATGERATVRLSGSVTRGGGRLRSLRREAADGRRVTLFAVLSKSRLNRKVLAQIRRGRNVRAKLTVTVTDRAGNVRRARRTVRLK